MCGNAYTNANCYSHGNGNAKRDRYGHSHADRVANADAVRRKMFSDAAASSDPSASPIAPVAAASLCEAQA